MPVARPAPEHGPHMRSSAKLPTLGPTPSALISVCGTHHETTSATRYPSTGLLPAGAARAPPWGGSTETGPLLSPKRTSGVRRAPLHESRRPPAGRRLRPEPQSRLCGPHAHARACSSLSKSTVGVTVSPSPVQAITSSPTDCPLHCQVGKGQGGGAVVEPLSSLEAEALRHQLVEVNSPRGV